MFATTAAGLNACVRPIEVESFFLHFNSESTLTRCS